MQQGPSQTALAAAMYRAAHQRLDDGRIFADPFAERILPAHVQPHLEVWAARRKRLLLRKFIAYRSRIAEARMAEAAARGTRQIVLVGAGFDTIGLRNPFPQVAIYEVDHPATQQWKRRRFQQLQLAVGRSVTFVPVDFERATLGESLAQAGFDATAPAFFSWLGVVPYLTETAIFSTLGFVASLPRSEVVFDYVNPLDEMGSAMRRLVERHAEGAASLGEPLMASFNTDALKARLAALGAVAIEDWSRRRMRGRVGDEAGMHIVHARWE